MQLYEMQVSKTQIYRTAPAKIPRGIVGAAVKLSFSPEWEGLTKTVVFRAGEITKDILDVKDVAVIPVECTQEEGVLLEIGVYGVDAESTVAIPTLWAAIGRVTEAADPSGDITTDPTLPVYAQLQEQIKQLEEQGVTQNEIEQALRDFFGGEKPTGKTTPEGGEIFNDYEKNTAASKAHAEGANTAAKGKNSHTEGKKTTALGENSHAEGEGSETGSYKKDEAGNFLDKDGNITTDPAQYVVEGGYAAHAEGYKTKALGTVSHTEGRETEAREYASHAEGRGTIAAARNQHVQGAFNVPDIPDADGKGKYAHIVGGGQNNNVRMNIHTLDWDGNAEFAGKIYSKGEEVALASQAAPAGFGLGEVNEVASLDDCVENGWYSYGVYSIFVQKINDNFIYQLRRSSDNYAEMTMETRQCINGVWDEWAWINPPMLLNTEYRTTERFSGKPVFVKRINYSIELGAVATQALNVPHGIANFANIVRCTARRGALTLPVIQSDKSLSVEWVNDTNIKVRLINYALAKSDGLSFDIYYTKS